MGLVDKISPAFELRNSGVPAVVRSSQLPAPTLRRPIKSAPISSQAGHRVPLAYLYVAPPGSWVGSTTVAVPRHCRPSPPGQSPAYTYLEQPLRLWRTCGSSYPGSIYPLRSEFVSCPSPGGGPTVVLCHPLCTALSSVLSLRASLHFASARVLMLSGTSSLLCPLPVV